MSEEAAERVRAALLSAHRAALDAVGGRQAVARQLRVLERASWPSHAVAIGKAASDMMLGALDVLDGTLDGALVLTKHEHAAALAAHAHEVSVMESSHPVPDASCLRSGAALWSFVADAPESARFLVMVSGGASALVEHLAPGLDEAFLVRVNDWLLSNALSIGPMNRVRKRISRIKGGRLALALSGRSAICLMISDVPDDDPKVIGSGPLVPHTHADIDVSDLNLPHWLSSVTAHPPALAPLAAFDNVRAQVVAHPALARAAAADALQRSGLHVEVHEVLLEGDAVEKGREVAELARRTPDVVHLWSSETTVRLPPRPGRGGRCQALALSAAGALVEDGVGLLLAAGTDGSDGPGGDAGALVDAQSIVRGRAAGRDAQADLLAANAGAFLDASGDLLRTGPTGTNVMDLVMAWCPPGG